MRTVTVTINRKAAREFCSACKRAEELVFSLRHEDGGAYHSERYETRGQLAWVRGDIERALDEEE